MSVPPSVRPSVRLYGKTRLPLGGFSWSLIFWCFSKICPENSSFIKIWQVYRVLCTKSSAHIWQYLAEFFLGWQIFNPLNAELSPICHLLALFGAHHIFHVSTIRVKIKVTGNIQTNISCSITIFFPRKSCHLWVNMEEYDAARGHRWKCNSAQEKCLCLPVN
jgi:hypothetical protein